MLLAGDEECDEADVLREPEDGPLLLRGRPRVSGRLVPNRPQTPRVENRPGDRHTLLEVSHSISLFFFL